MPLGVKSFALMDRVCPPAFGPQFKLFLTSSWLANLGDGILLAAGPLLVASLTPSPVLVAMGRIMQQLPFFLLGIAAGLIIDRYDRRLIVIISEIVRVVALATISLAILTNMCSISLVLACLFFLGAAQMFSFLSFDSMFPSLIPPEHLGKAGARMTFGYMTLQYLVGPPVGAVLFTVGKYIPIIMAAFCYFAGILCIVRITVPPTETAQDSTSFVDESCKAIAWTFNHSAMRTMFILTAVTMSLYGATNAMLVLYVTESLGLNQEAFGLFLALQAIGGVVGTLIFGNLEAKFSYGTMIRGVLFAGCLSQVFFGFFLDARLALIGMFIFGAHEAIWDIVSRTVRQRAVPEDLRGRVTSMYLIFIQGGMVIGGLMGGYIASTFTIVDVFRYAFFGEMFIIMALWKQLRYIAHDKEGTVEESIPLKV